MDLLGATKVDIEQLFKSSSILPPRFGDVTQSGQHDVGDFVYLFGYKSLDGSPNGPLTVVYAMKRRNGSLSATLSNGDILPHLYRCKGGGVWNVIPLDPIPRPPPQVNPPAPPIRDRTFQHLVPSGNNLLPTGAFAKEGKVRQRLICYTSDWFGDPDAAMLNWN